MKTEKNWNKAKWIFESDGALRDIYVQDVNESDWKKLIDYLNSEYVLEFGIDKERSSSKIDFDFIQKMWNDETGELETKSLTIDLNGIFIKSYFFSPKQIEFDIKPSQIKSLLELNRILEIMNSISKVLKKQATLTGENQAEFPLIKIDSQNGTKIILTKKEMIRISKKTCIYDGWISRIKNLISQKKITMEELEYKAMESACKPFEPVEKEKNVW